MKKFLLNLGTLLIAGLICLAAAEAALRATRPTFDHEKQIYVWSSPTLEKGPALEVRYMPNQRIREWSVYAGRIEFDNVFQTNNWGYVDHEDYLEAPLPPNRASYVFLGDSFTAGQGAVPWVPALRDRLRGKGMAVDIYNFGVLGGGILNNYETLRNNVTRVRYQHIVLLPISDDFTRLYWRPVVANDTVVLCPTNESDEFCAEKSPAALLVDFESTDAAILEKTRATVAPPADLQSWFRKTELFQQTRSLWNKKFNRLAIANQKIQDAIDKGKRKVNLAAIADMRKRLPNVPIHLIHLPEKQEVANGKYELDLKETMEKMGVRYYPALYDCHWSADMYHRFDPHPNAKGYEAISRCVEKYLFSDPKNG